MSETLDEVGIAERRSAAQDALVGLREERGRALVRGEPFDASRISEAEQELAALTDAEGEVWRQRRAAEAEAEQIRRTGITKLVKASEEKRLAALSRAEAATRELAEALPAIDAATAESTRLLRLIGEGEMASQLDLGVHPSMRIAAVLGGLGSWATRLGTAGPPVRLGELVRSIGNRSRNSELGRTEK